MKKLITLLLFFASSLFAEVQVTLKNQSNIPITAIKKRFGCVKIIRGEMTACSSVNIPAGGQQIIREPKPFNIAIHHQEKGQNLRFITQNKVKNNEVLVFPSNQFKVLKGKFPTRMQMQQPTQPKPIPVAKPKPTISPPLVAPKIPPVEKESNEAIITIYGAMMNTSDEQLNSFEKEKLVGLLIRVDNIIKQLKTMSNNDKKDLNELIKDQNEIRKKRNMELLPKNIDGIIKGFDQLQVKLIPILREKAKEKDVLDLTDEELIQRIYGSGI